MERFYGLEMYLAGTIPVTVLLAAFFYLGYRKSCSLAALILAQLFAFFSIMVIVTLLGVYQWIPAVVMPIIYLLIMLVFFVGGSTLTGILMEAKAWAEIERKAQEKGEK